MGGQRPENAGAVVKDDVVQPAYELEERGDEPANSSNCIVVLRFEERHSWCCAGELVVLDVMVDWCELVVMGWCRLVSSDGVV